MAFKPSQYIYQQILPEAWYGLTKSNVETLEWNDLNLLIKFFEVPSSRPKEIMYLETGCLTISYIIVSRRLMFLHYILNTDEHSLIYKFFQSQLRSPPKKAEIQKTTQ